MAQTQNASASIQTQDIMSIIDLKPQHLAELFRMNNIGMESRAFMYSHTMGFSEPVGGTTFYHTEKDLSNASLTVDAHAAGAAAGTAVTYTLNGDSKTYFYVRLNDVIEYKTGEQGLVTAVDSAAGTFKVTPSAAVTLPAVAQDEHLIITTRAFGSGTEVGQPAFTRSSKKSGRTQILKDKVSADGTSLTDATWVKYGDKGYFSMQLVDGNLRHLRHIEGMFLHGKETTDIADPYADATGKAITSGGLIEAASAGYTGGTVPTTMGSFDVYSQHFIANGVSKTTHIHNMLGFDAMQAINKAFMGSSSVLVDSMKFLTQTTDETLAKKSEAYGAFNNFKYYNSQYTYEFEINEAWSDPTAYGADGYSYSGASLMIPVYKVKDGMSGKYFGTIGTRYKSLNGVNRKLMIDDHNGFGTVNGKTISELDVTSTVYLSDIGGQFMGAYQYAWAK